MAALTAAVCLLALVMLWLKATTTLEAIAFVTGALCVWMVVRENVLNFPLGLVNVAIFSYIFFRSGLFADAGLQVVYFGLNIAGWLMWMRGGLNGSTLVIDRTPRIELMAVNVCVVIATLVLWRTLHVYGGSASFWDALTTSISLGAQWLLNRKHVENWIGWIIADFIYIPLYLYKELYLTSILYAVFLVMAVIGYLQWRQRWMEQNQKNETVKQCGPGLL
jgi:nicotinamide mononucleotide transporter